MRKAQRTVVGWREWITLPELSPAPVKAKVDTGARTSALHAFRLDVRTVSGVITASFELHPQQRSAADAVQVALPVMDFRKVRSSNGKLEERPVVRTTVQLGEEAWPVDITLTSRDQMGFRMLLGRTALRRRFVVDPGRSFVASKEINDMRKRRTS